MEASSEASMGHLDHKNKPIETMSITGDLAHMVVM